MTALGKLLQRRMDQLGIVSRRQGSLLSGIDKDTFNDLVRGAPLAPREDTLRRIADWTGVSIQDVREAAGRPRGEAPRFVLPDWADELSAVEREAVLALARALRARHVDGGKGRDTASATVEAHVAPDKDAPSHSDGRQPKLTDRSDISATDDQKR